MTRSIAVDASTGRSARSIELFYEPGDRCAGPVGSIVVTEELRRSGDSLQAHVRRQLLHLKASELSHLDVGESDALEIGGCEASRTNVSWSGREGRIEHLLVHVDRPDAPDTVLTVTLTVVPGMEAPLELLERMLATFRLPTAAAPDEAAAPQKPKPAPLRSGFIELRPKDAATAEEIARTFGELELAVVTPKS